MINAGITGGEHIYAGELVRILINHPDVNIRWVASDVAQGPVAHFHPGLTGECDLEFSKPSLDDVNLIFCCGTDDWCTQAQHDYPELRIINLTRHLAQGGMYGLCEVNRKFMVHDCYDQVAVPSPLAMVALLPLVPLAKHHLLNNRDRITVNIDSAPMWATLSPQLIKQEILSVLSFMQPHYDGSTLHINISSLDDTKRAVMASIATTCEGDEASIRSIIDDYYDDHNFTFTTPREVAPCEVINTNKCLMHITMIEDELTIHSVIDGLIKGAAGNAIHIMNLLFGLHERVGLTLKAQVL